MLLQRVVKIWSISVITGSSIGQCSSGWVDARVGNSRRTLLTPGSSFLSMQGVPHGHWKLHLVGNHCRGLTALLFNLSNNYLFNICYRSGIILGIEEEMNKTNNVLATGRLNSSVEVQ